MAEAERKAKPLPKVFNHDIAKAVLEAAGWVPTIGGKHATKMEKEGRRPITIPRHHGRDWGKRLRADILREAGLKGSGATDDNESDEMDGDERDGE